MAGKADYVSLVSASGCYIGGPIYVNPGKLALVYGRFDAKLYIPFLLTLRGGLQIFRVRKRPASVSGFEVSSSDNTISYPIFKSSIRKTSAAAVTATQAVTGRNLSIR